MRWLPLLCLALASPAAAKIHAVVVGNNHALPGSGYERLEYADDDALRFAALLTELGAQVHLLTGADPDSAQGWPTLADRAIAPTRAHLVAALSAVKSAVDDDPAAEVFVYFSGHGSLDAATAWLHLLDGRFTRTDVHTHILDGLSAARRVHVIIDSCHSWFLVNARGARVAVAADEQSLDRYPQAGFLLSTSQAKEVHEWSGYRAGVFSHQLLGALRGAADVDGDGRVSYGEAHAYLAAANLGITDPRARIQPEVRRPAVRGDTLMTLPEARVPVPAQVSGHLFIEGARGDRLLDAHKAAGVPMAVHLPAGPARLFVGGQRFELVRDGAARFEPAPAELSEVASRGTLADQFRERLFLRPLTPEFVAGFQAGTDADLAAAAPPRLEPSPWYEDPLTVGLLGGGVLGLATAGVLTPLYLEAAGEADARPVSADTEDAAGRANRLGIGMAVGYAAGGALLIGGLTRLLAGDLGSAPRASLGPGSVNVALPW